MKSYAWNTEQIVATAAAAAECKNKIRTTKRAQWHAVQSWNFFIVFGELQI